MCRSLSLVAASGRGPVKKPSPPLRVQSWRSIPATAGDGGNQARFGEPVLTGTAVVSIPGCRRRCC